MFKLQLLHGNGSVRYNGFMKRKPKNSQQIDEQGILLFLFEGRVLEYDRNGNFIQFFCIKSGKRQTNDKKIVEYHHCLSSTDQQDSVENYSGFGVQYDYDRNYRIRILFLGNIKNGKRCGFGKLYQEDGTVIFEGTWKNDKPHGFGTRYHPNGKILLKGYWSKGVPSSNCIIYAPCGAILFQGFIIGHIDIPMKNILSRVFYRDSSYDHVLRQGFVNEQYNVPITDIFKMILNLEKGW
jgi:antitoxin component YwqK of YwqJK toxin-antitoxin module